MRKKFFSTVFILILGYLGMFVTGSYALSIDDLEGKECIVLMYCDADVRDYCSEDRIKLEDFIFESDSEFMIGTFKDETFLGFDTASGEYEDHGIFFLADFSVIEDLVKKYEFDILVFNIVDTVIIGMCSVIYYEFGITKLDYVKEDEANCYFIGFSH